MSECVGRDAVSSIADRVGEVVAIDIMEMYVVEGFG